VGKTSLAVAERAAAEAQAAARWARVRSQFWYLLFAGAAVTVVCLAVSGLRELAGYPAAVAAGSGFVLLFASSLRSVVADLAASAWGLIPVVLILGGVGGTGWFLWTRFVREKRTLGAVITGIEATDAGVHAAVKHAAEAARVEPYLNATLVKRGLSKGNA